jgi:hypothetical protein
MRRNEALTLIAALAALPKVMSGQESVPAGKTFMPSLPSAPYPDPSRANGHVYEGVLYSAALHYSDSTVGIYVPPQFRPTPAINVIVHFHGWKNHVAEVFRRYRLREQLDASGLNAVLVVPQGPKDSPDSGFGKLELDNDGFLRFVNDVLHYLAANGYPVVASARRIALTSHSGGYGGAGGVLTRGGMNESITDVILFDSAYGYFDAFASWERGAPARHLMSLFTDDTATGNAILAAKVQAPAPNIFMRDASVMTLAELETRLPTFIVTTKVAHDELLQQLNWFELFLKTTALA